MERPDRADILSGLDYLLEHLPPPLDMPGAISDAADGLRGAIEAGSYEEPITVETKSRVLRCAAELKAVLAGHAFEQDRYMSSLLDMAEKIEAGALDRP